MLSAVPGASQHQTVANLPFAAQQSISSAIGRDQPTYHAAPTATGATLANPVNGFTAQVRSGALQISAGPDTWDMALMGLGYGGAVQTPGTAQTSVDGNRVDSRYRAIDEWFVNGPGGLEQGFTVASPTQSEAGGSLTVELALTGDLTGTVERGGQRARVGAAGRYARAELRRADGLRLHGQDAAGHAASADRGQPPGTVDPRQRCGGKGPDHHRPGGGSVRRQHLRQRLRGQCLLRPVGGDQRRHGGSRRQWHR